MSGNLNRWNRASSSSSGRNRSLATHINCIICSEQYKTVDNIYAGTCGHVFHWECLQRWWEESRKCPICRSTSADYFQIYLDFDESMQSENGPPNRNQHTGQSTSASTAIDTSDYENLLYESGLYREEIKYLESCINQLTLKVNLLADITTDSD